jgi:hypothetical protein
MTCLGVVLITHSLPRRRPLTFARPLLPPSFSLHSRGAETAHVGAALGVTALRESLLATEAILGIFLVPFCSWRATALSSKF